MKHISASVGLRGVNRPYDVETVQDLLNQVPHQEGGPLRELKVDGRCGRKTNSAIEKFQAKTWNWKRATARVEPDSETWKLLRGYEPEPTPAATPPPPPPPKVTSRAFLISVAAHAFSRLREENMYFKIVDNTDQTRRALYYFGGDPAPPQLAVDAPWSISKPPVVLSEHALAVDDFAGTATMLESTTRAGGVRNRMMIFPASLGGKSVRFEIYASINEPYSGPGSVSTQTHAEFRLISAST